jgi:hypothetical protein
MLAVEKPSFAGGTAFGGSGVLLDAPGSLICGGESDSSLIWQTIRCATTEQRFGLETLDGQPGGRIGTQRGPAGCTWPRWC